MSLIVSDASGYSVSLSIFVDLYSFLSIVCTMRFSIYPTTSNSLFLKA
jgi:hypothetical protein